MPYKFKVGDLVVVRKIVHDKEETPEFRAYLYTLVGKVGRISKVYGYNDHPYGIYVDSNQEVTFHVSELDFPTEEEEATYYLKELRSS